MEIVTKEEIISEYPILFKKNSLRSGFQNIVGWMPLIKKLSSYIEHELKTYASVEEQEQTSVCQIKQKFGGLRYCIDLPSTNEKVYYKIQGAIALAEMLSFNICEECGLPGKVKNTGWAKTLCDIHDQERQK